MAELTWSPDAEKTFAKLIEAIPEAMREMIKPKLLEMLAAKAAGETVTTDIITRMVQDDLPEPQKSGLLQALGAEKPASDSPAGGADDSPSVTWSGKSEAMFEIMLGEVPEAMREVFRGKLLGVITEKAQGGPATEEHVTAVVNEIVPEPFKSSILDKFKQVGDFDIKVVDAIIDRHGTAQESLMFILHDIQAAIGYLPIEALRIVSSKCSLNLSTIYNVVTFYKAFKLTPPGKHHVKICCGTACHLTDKDGLSDSIEEKVAACPDVTLEKTLCLGCCDCSPVVEIDGKVYTGNEAKTKIDSIVS